MNNHRLLTGLFCLSALLGGGMHVAGQCPKAISLEEIFRSAEKNSTQLRPAISAEEKARHDIETARTQRLPEIDATLSVCYIGNGFTTGRNFSDYQKAPIPHCGNTLALNITQPLYTGGAVTKSVEIAELRSTAARYAADLQHDNIRFRLTGFYLDIYRYSNMQTVVGNHIAQARKMLDEMRARHEQGTALQNDIVRYELLVSDLELQLVRIENTLDILNHNLVVTAGLPAHTRIQPDSTLLNRSLPRNSKDWWQQETASHSPSLQLARSDIEINRKNESLVRSGRLPKIGLQSGWSFDGPILVEIPPVNRSLSYWYVGLGISYNLSSLYKNNKSFARSRTSTRLAQEKLDAMLEDISLSVHADYIRYLETYEELKTQQKRVELAGRNYRTTATRYSAGMVLLTDMLEAANTRLEAERRLVDARINLIYYYYKLLFISGKI